MLDLIAAPWHWSVSGLAIASVMFLLLYVGKEFGVSSNLRTMCSIAGAGKKYSFFNFDWKGQRWNLTFIAGAILGGFLAFNVLPSTDPIEISANTIAYLSELGIEGPGAPREPSAFVPGEFFAPENLFSIKGMAILIGGGFLVGFGARWAGGCTSGHAISGLSNLQLPSLIAVVGFFIGGLTMTWLLLPLIAQI